MTAGTKETATSSADFLARTYDLEMAKGFVTSTPKPSDLFYEHSGEGSGELDAVDAEVHASGMTQQLGKEAPHVSDRPWKNIPRFQVLKLLLLMDSRQFPWCCRSILSRMKALPGAASTLASTASYERATEGAADSFQDHFGDSRIQC